MKVENHIIHILQEKKIFETDIVIMYSLWIIISIVETLIWDLRNIF